jgi:hypothetical protein
MLAVIVHGLGCLVAADVAAKKLKSQVPSTIKFKFPSLRSSGNVWESFGRGTFVFGTWTVDADSVRYSSETMDIKLLGNVLMKGQGLEFKTDLLEMNLKSKNGRTSAIRGHFEPMETVDEKLDLSIKASDRKVNFATRSYHISADEALIRDRMGKYDVVMRSVSLTDCDAHRPHHDIFVGKMRWSQDHRVELQHAVPRISVVPYFYLPWLGRDLGRDWPWTRWTFGSQSDWGRYTTFETLLWPEKTDEDLRMMLGVRENRGVSLDLFWDHRSGMDVQKIDFYYTHERWKEDAITLETDLIRLDWEERRRLDPHWNFNLDLHYQGPRERSVWSGNGLWQSSNDFYQSPFGANVLSFQEREIFLQDYHQERWDSDRLDENEVSLQYQKGSRYFSLSSLYPSDGEQLVGRSKLFEMRWRELKKPLRSSPWNWSADLGLTKVGQRLGWELSDADLMTLSGNVKRKSFEMWRGDALFKVERPSKLGAFRLRPWLGMKSLSYGDVLKRGQQGKAFYDMDENTDLDGSLHHQRALAGLELSSVVSGSYKSGSLLHQVRPSLHYKMAGPTGWDHDRVLMLVDEIDLEERPEFELVWRLEQEWLKPQHRRDEHDPLNRRLLYYSSLEYRQLFRDDDRRLLMGNDHKGGADLRFHHALYPSRFWNAYGEIQWNSVQRQMPWLRSGFRVEKSGHLLEYSYNYRKDLRNPTEVSNRHDVTYRFASRWDDFSMLLSWDGDQQLSTIKSDDFYNRGFRRFDVAWGHTFHCLRTELAFEYDFEDSGATFVFRFGPEFLRNNLPHLRNGVQGL